MTARARISPARLDCRADDWMVKETPFERAQK